MGYTINPVSTVEFDTKNRAACTREVTGIPGREGILMHEETVMKLSKNMSLLIGRYNDGFLVTGRDYIMGLDRSFSEVCGNKLMELGYGHWPH